MISKEAILIVQRTITQAGRQQPADARLHSELKKSTISSPEIAQQASRLLFAYYRWVRWLNQALPIVDQIRDALRKDEQFLAHSDTVPMTELREKAVPAWLSSEMEIPDPWLFTLQQMPRLWLRARGDKKDIVVNQLCGCRIVWPELMPTCIEYSGTEDLFRHPLFREGCFEIQDLSSQLVGWFCNPQPGETWWDACAGEGGKTLHLSDLMQNKGLIWATDRASWRLQTLKRRAARAQMFNYRSKTWDGSGHLPTKTRFDGILVDAPCSGIGTWHRNPHARWTTSAHDVRELSQVQLQMLNNACRNLKPGGKLVYSVCTLTHQETQDVVTEFESTHPEFVPWPVSHPLITSGPSEATHYLWPQDHGGNGMFVAIWKRAN